jgi:methylase of polypeptide subunit release factors
VTIEALVSELVEQRTLTGATLSNPRRKGGAGPSRVTVRPVLVAGALRYGWTAHYATRTATENLEPAETERRLVELLRGDFRQALLHAERADYQVLVSRSARILERPATRPDVSLEHDRRKRYALEEGTPVPFLVELGVMNAEGKVLARRYDKFRQVNRFVELVGDITPALQPEGTLRVVDFGSGKSYLTFALHHLLRELQGRDVEIVGLDLKEDVVERCAALAERLGAEGLQFRVGDIAGADLGRADLVVSLHACDTATDDALARAVHWQADAILAVPCCQHELSGQIDNAMLAPVLRHGVLRERFAADVTDAVRAQLLGLVGYDVQLVEFVELEHTPKNVLIRAVRRPGRSTERLAREYHELKRALGLDPSLERALASELAPVLRG